MKLCMGWISQRAKLVNQSQVGYSRHLKGRLRLVPLKINVTKNLLCENYSSFEEYKWILRKLFTFKYKWQLWKSINFYSTNFESEKPY